MGSKLEEDTRIESHTQDILAQVQKDFFSTSASFNLKSLALRSVIGVGSL